MSDNEIVEVRQIHEMSDLPADVQEVAKVPWIFRTRLPPKA